jgi:hypothetical protein
VARRRKQAVGFGKIGTREAPCADDTVNTIELTEAIGMAKADAIDIGESA